MNEVTGTQSLQTLQGTDHDRKNISFVFQESSFPIKMRILKSSTDT